jgi:putative phosphoesterase
MVLDKVSPVDLLVHLGDLEGSEDYLTMIAPCPVEMVSGNNDYFTDIERDKMITIGKYKVFLTHGHRYRVNYDIDTIKEEARQRGADMVMFGHTHKPVIDLTSGVIAINPGSISQPRQEGRIPTYVIMDIDNKGEAHFTLNFVSC